jgi:hypothetical protein
MTHPAAALLLVFRIAAAQEPVRPVAVVVLPAAIRDSMFAVWTANNRHWDYIPPNTPSEVVSNAPTRRYVGCVTGSAVGDTLLVRTLKPATGVKRGLTGVSADCSNVSDLIGTWQTHPYRAGFQGRPIKERGVSGREFRALAEAGGLVTITVWDVDSLDLATREPGGGVRHHVPYIVR